LKKFLLYQGKVDPLNGSITGDHIAYIYPDMETAYIGTFNNKFMRAARETEVKVRTLIWKDTERERERERERENA